MCEGKFSLTGTSKKEVETDVYWLFIDFVEFAYHSSKFTLFYKKPKPHKKPKVAELGIMGKNLNTHIVSYWK